MKFFLLKPAFKIDDIISYSGLVTAEGINLQRKPISNKVIKGVL